MTICKLVIKDGEVEEQISFEAPQALSTDIDQIIEEDKKYGNLPLQNGLVTYRMYGTLPRGLTRYQVERAIRFGLQRWKFFTAIKTIREARLDEIPTLKIYNRTVAQDSNLTNSTIMYAFFPISTSNRGIVVINSDSFYYTPHGNSESMFKIDPINYPPNTTVKGATIDVDQVFGHEFGHSFGLPHDPLGGNIMSSHYGVMAEFPSDRDIKRMQAKIGKRSSILANFLHIFSVFKRSSDR